MLNPVVVNLYLFVMLLLASIPFVNQRLFALIPVAAFRSGGKPFVVRAVEWFVCFLLALGLGLLLENRVGSIHPQDWEFYAVMLVLFSVFSVPGFIWQYQLKKVVLKK